MLHMRDLLIEARAFKITACFPNWFNPNHDHMSAEETEACDPRTAPISMTALRLIRSVSCLVPGERIKFMSYSNSIATYLHVSGVWSDQTGFSDQRSTGLPFQFNDKAYEGCTVIAACKPDAVYRAVRARAFGYRGETFEHHVFDVVRDKSDALVRWMLSDDLHAEPPIEFVIAIEANAWVRKIAINKDYACHVLVQLNMIEEHFMPFLLMLDTGELVTSHPMFLFRE